MHRAVLRLDQPQQDRDVLGVGALSRVVVYSSLNLTFQQNNYVDNAVVIAGDVDLYDATRRYFDDLRAGRRTARYFGTTPCGGP
jgi:hypothetical protein